VRWSERKELPSYPISYRTALKAGSGKRWSKERAGGGRAHDYDKFYRRKGDWGLGTKIGIVWTYPDT